MRRFLNILFLAILIISCLSGAALAAGENVVYNCYVQGTGWMTPVTTNDLCGTTGEDKGIGAINIALKESDPENHISYAAHLQDIGWMDYVNDGTEAGLPAQGKNVEAFRAKLSGPISNAYDIYYRAHCSDFGWLGWAKNDEVAGSTGFCKRIEAFQITLVPKGNPALGVTGNHGPDRETVRSGQTGLDETTGITYRAYCSNIAWQDPVVNGATAGTTGQQLPIEKLSASLKNLSGSVQYNTYLSDKGWQTPTADGAENGLSDSHVHIEAVQFVLSGDVKGQFDIYYRTHVRNIGWLGWTKNGENSGTKDGNRPVEAIEVRLVHKGDRAPGSMEESYIDFPVYYATHQRPQAVPGKRTLKNFLVTSLLPVGQTCYIWGGGRDARHPAGGVDGTYIGVYPQWKAFFDQQDGSYDYKKHLYEYGNGLDCSGFVGWLVYNTLNTQSGGRGEIDLAPNEPINYSRQGYGSYTPPGYVKEYKPGDIISANQRGHIYVVIGTCSDGSMVICHASDPGIMLSGTAPTVNSSTEATRLAHKYMQRYYPEFYRRYAGKLNRDIISHTARSSKFVWGDNFVGDPENLRNMDAEHVLKVLFNEKY